MYPSGKLLHSLALSKLLPKMFRKSSESGVPYIALYFGSIFGFCIAIWVYMDPSLLAYLFNLCMLFAFCAYISQCVGYIYLQTIFSSVDREFRSPLGIYGAYYAILVFSVGIVSIIGFQDDDRKVFGVFVLLYFSLSVYYFTYAERRQKMSIEEERAHLGLLIIRYRHTLENRKKLMSKRVATSSGRSSDYFHSSSNQSEEKIDKQSELVGETSTLHNSENEIDSSHTSFSMDGISLVQLNPMHRKT
jgi:amino acid permease